MFGNGGNKSGYGVLDSLMGERNSVLSPFRPYEPAAASISPTIDTSLIHKSTPISTSVPNYNNAHYFNEMKNIPGHW